MTELADVVADDHLVDALAAGHTPPDPAAAALAGWRDQQTTSGPALGDPLTWREQRVLELIADGMSSQQAGRRLHLSPETVKTHARRIYRKLGARDRAHAVHLAHQRGLLGGAS